MTRTSSRSSSGHWQTPAPDVRRRRSRPDPALGAAAVRAAVDFADAADLAAKLEKLLTAFATGNQALFRMLRQQGAFVGRGPAPKVAFLYTGQGSQYVNMLSELRAHRADRGRHLPGGRRGDDPAARPAALVVHLHRRR